MHSWYMVYILDWIPNDKKKKVENIQYDLIIVKNLYPMIFTIQKNKNHYPANFWDIRVIDMHASGCLGNLTLE